MTIQLVQYEALGSLMSRQINNAKYDQDTRVRQLQWCRIKESMMMIKMLTGSVTLSL